MASSFALADEIFFQILKDVMRSSFPVEVSAFIKSSEISRSQGVKNLFKQVSCNRPFCKWLSNVHGRRICTCATGGAFPRPQEEHFKDWYIVTRVSHRFRIWAKDAFFLEKTFSIPPSLIRRLCDGTIKSFSIENEELLLKHARRILCPLPACRAATAFLTLPRYQQFEHLQVLALWPGTYSLQDPAITFLSETLQDPAPKEMIGLLRGIGFTRKGIRLDVVRTVDEVEWAKRVNEMELQVFPYLRWVGNQRANAAGKK